MKCNDLSFAKEKSNDKKKHSIIAISGMPGAGKTTLSKALIDRMPNLVCFDFGAFFRPIALFLIKYKGMSIDELRSIIKSGKIDELMKTLNLNYRVRNRMCEISINGFFFEESELYNPEMNKITVDVGSCFGDSLNEQIKYFIEIIRQKNPVLLNARKPFTVCDDISNHIFLKADFHKRAERKAKIESDSIEQAIDNLKKRDEKEIKAEFWKTYSFTKIIDTTEMNVDEALDVTQKHILGYTIKEEEKNREKMKCSNNEREFL